MTNRGGDEMDALDRDVLRFDAAPGPSAAFVAELRASLRHEARRLEAAPVMNAPQAAAPATVAWSTPRPAAIRARRQPSVRLPRLSPLVSRAATLGLVLALLALSATLLNDLRRPDARPTIPAGFAVATPASVDYANMPMPGGNPARTNVQPGPGLANAPQVAQQANSTGSGIALVDGLLIVVNLKTMTALDAATLRERWSVELGYALYSAPTVANGQIFLTATRDTESARGDAEDFPLIALSTDDGRELWRVEGGGAFPASPVVDGDVVYAFGVANGAYQVGAYRTADGQALWQTEVIQFKWCCPGLGIALADGLLAVNHPQELRVYDAKTGEQRWSRPNVDGEQIGTPMIVGDRVIVNAASEDLGESVVQVETGATTAYDLRTGEILWTNASTRSYRSTLSATPNGILYAGKWVDEAQGRLALLSAETGEVIWSTPLPRIEGDVQTYIGLNGETAPIILGDTAYVVVGTPPIGGSSNTSSLLAVIDLATGAVRWMAQLDGNIVPTPIVSGGRVFALTYDAGLVVLEASSQPTVAAGTTVDLRAPEVCAALPAQSPLLGELPAAPSIPGVANWQEPILFSQIWPGPAGAVDAATAVQLEQRFREYRSCSAVDPYTSVFGFFSTDFYVRLKPLGEAVYHSDEQPWAVWMAPMQEFLYLEKNSLRVLPDGRIGGVVNSPSTNIYVWWVQEEGVWTIDEYHRIQADPIDPNAATPPPSLNADGASLG